MICYICMLRVGMRCAQQQERLNIFYSCDHIFDTRNIKNTLLYRKSLSDPHGLKSILIGVKILDLGVRVRNIRHWQTLRRFFNCWNIRHRQTFKQEFLTGKNIWQRFFTWKNIRHGQIFSRFFTLVMDHRSSGVSDEVMLY